LIKYRYEAQYRSTEKLFATCYSKLDGPVEARGIYANESIDRHPKRDRLPRQERRIQRSHYSVALPPELKEKHKALIKIPGVGWRHKWLVHVPDYNKGNRNQSIRKGYPFDPYFSVPRDRMKWKGRIDVLFTTSGIYASIKQRQTYWKRKGTKQWPCDFWEIVKIAVYSDGSERVVE